ncbi:glucosaminidase domain-containing protein [Candidatus Gracilibacteria bacterium]|nr:glucosaminidase domain-containing protein [Candidatus Gracilibacteria bacterium]
MSHNLDVQQNKELPQALLLEGLCVLNKYFQIKENRDETFVSELEKISQMIQAESVTKTFDQIITEYRDFFTSHILKIKTAILAVKDQEKKEKLIPLLLLCSENPVLSSFYETFGKPYKLGSQRESATDCIQILRQNDALMNLVEKSPTRFISDGADLVFHENFGKVVDKVDRDDFSRLPKYKPNKDKIYIFALAKPPLTFQGKPNITHIQISTNLNENNRELSVLHASSDKGVVSIERNIKDYLKKNSFERVFVIEVDLKSPNTKDLVERNLHVVSENYDKKRYERLPMKDVPLLPREEFNLIGSSRLDFLNPLRNGTVEISEEEIKTLDLLSENQELKLLTLITAIREGKIGEWQNIKESVAYATFFSPENRSLGVHQVTKITNTLFNKWIDEITEKKAESFGEPINSFWKKKQNGQEIQWSELTPYLTSYKSQLKLGNFLDYKDTKISTICAYLLLEDIVENELKSAYRVYNEAPFRGLEEQPENIIAIAGAYRNSMDVMITGSQQYRLAEIACEVGLIGTDFNFTKKVKAMPEYRIFIEKLQNEYTNMDYKGKKLFEEEFVVDGYRGIQFTFLAYLVYKHEYPEDIKFSYDDFEKAFGTTRTNMLVHESLKTDSEEQKNVRSVVDIIHVIYERYFGRRPPLLMSENELRNPKSTKLDTKKIKFANEGLWAESYFQKYNYENWNLVKKTDGVLQNHLKKRSIRTNEISKLSPEKVQIFNAIIQKIPDNKYYKRYPSVLLSIAYNGGFIDKVKFEESNRQLVDDFTKYMDELFISKVAGLEQSAGRLSVEEKVQIAPLLSFISSESMISILKNGIYLSKKETHSHSVDKNNFHEDLTVLLERSGSRSFFVRDDLGGLKEIDSKNIVRSIKYPKSFEVLERRFQIKSIEKLKKKNIESISSKEKKELFVLNLLEKSKKIAQQNGFSINFAYVVCAMAVLETGWGSEKNEWDEATLINAAHNLFSIKANYKQYSLEDYENQNFPYYIHHTKEYVRSKNILSRYKDGTLKEFVFSGKNYQIEKKKEKYFITWEKGKEIEFKQGMNEDGAVYFECYEAFKKYASSEDSLKDLTRLINTERYTLTRAQSAISDLSVEVMGGVFDALISDGYATDPIYAKNGLSIARSIIGIERKYGQEL